MQTIPVYSYDSIIIKEYMNVCRYDDLIESHNTTLEKLRSAQEENSRLKTQCHDLTQERNAVVCIYTI